LVVFQIVYSQYYIKLVAGKGVSGYSGDNGPATSAKLYGPNAVAVDANGVMYIADTENSVVRKVDIYGNITTIAGNGTSGYYGDNGPATKAMIYLAYGVSLDAAGNVYIADNLNYVIRKVNMVSGIITTVAGNGGHGYSGDGGLAIHASLFEPQAVFIDSVGNMYIADTGNSVIRMVNTTGYIKTVAGNGNNDYTGDGGQAKKAALYNPFGVSVDSNGNIYIADTFNNRVRKVNGSGIITTIAGNGSNLYTGNGGPANQSTVDSPGGTFADSYGNVYIADSNNCVIRLINASTGIISTVVGNGGCGYTGNGGLATKAQLAFPGGVFVTPDGVIYVADSNNNVIQKVSYTLPPTGTGSTSGSATTATGSATTATGSTTLAGPTSSITVSTEKSQAHSLYHIVIISVILVLLNL